MTTLLDDLLAKLGALPEAERKVIEEEVLKGTAGMKIIPSPGPQSRAYDSKADVLLYGGSAGGGKSALLMALALQEHKRSLIMRRRYTDLGALTDEALKFYGSRDGFNGSPPPSLRTEDDRLIEFGAANHPGDEDKWRGRAHDFLGIDEATQFLEQQVRFLMGWVRTTEPGQRTRVVLATNPPTTADGDWVVGMFRPWLDVTHPKPAKPGELRWFISDPDGKDMEVPGPAPLEIDGLTYRPMSRTFIPASVDDNPFLAKTTYKANLDSLPEPLRSTVRDGNFMAARQDADFQVIPTAWVIAAQARWTPRPPEGVAMTAQALDPAGGGRDSAELACRYGGWYAELISAQGEETADGSSTAATVMKHRHDNCPVVVDVGGGYGGAVTMRLGDNGVVAVGFNGANSSTAKTKDGQLSFANKRAEAWWKFREELDPDQEGGSVIALPPDPELRADLTAPTWSLTQRGILLESKDDLRKRLGRSPGKGDAVVYCLSEGNKAMKRKYAAGASPKVVMGHPAARRKR